MAGSQRKVTFNQFPEVGNNDQNQYLVGFCDTIKQGFKERKFKFDGIFFGTKGIYIKGDDTNLWYRLRIKGSKDEELLGFDEGISSPE